MKDKSVFDVHQIDLNALARSIGLATAPRVRFLQKHLKEAGASKKKSIESVPPTSTAIVKPVEKDWRRRDLETTYQFHTEEEEQDSNSDDDVLKLKRKDHALPFDDTVEAVETDNKKKTKILTKEKVAKRILAKKLKANQIVTFDDEGNVSLLLLNTFLVCFQG